MLSNKRILYICTPFHEYPERIKEAIESLNGIVDMFYIQQRSFLSTFLLNLSDKYYEKFRRFKQNQLLKRIRNKNYNFVFIQYPFFLSHEFFHQLKMNQQNAIFLNYNWDSIESSDFTPYIKYFDKVFSFDNDDCLTVDGIQYLPLFFTKDFKFNPNSDKKFDLIFIGGIGDSENRYEFVKKLDQICKERSIIFHKYLYCPINHFVKSFIKGKLYRGVYFKRISLSEISSLYNESRCVIDFQNPKQKGLTMRTFEVLGSGCKLITTNNRILAADFMNSEFISVIDKENPEIDVEFLYKDTNKYYSFKDFSINSWLDKIFND